MSTVTLDKPIIAKNVSGKPVVVSKTAYAALVLLRQAIETSGEKYVRFPDIEGKNASINELYRAKGVLDKRGERSSAIYGFKIPFEQIVESQRSYKVDVKATSTKSPKPFLPSGVYKRLPTFDILSQFVGAVTRESTELSKDRHDDLSRQIQELKKRLAMVDGDEEHRVLMSLNSLYEQRRNIKGELTIEAIKNVAAKPEFRAIDWSQVVSINVRDYGID